MVPLLTSEGPVDIITPDPPEYDPETRRWQVKRTIRYSNALFTSQFAVAKTGQVEMLDDKPLGVFREDAVERRHKQFRLGAVPPGDLPSEDNREEAN